MMPGPYRHRHAGQALRGTDHGDHHRTWPPRSQCPGQGRHVPAPPVDQERAGRSADRQHLRQVHRPRRGHPLCPLGLPDPRPRRAISTSRRSATKAACGCWKRSSACCSTARIATIRNRSSSWCCSIEMFRNCTRTFRARRTVAKSSCRLARLPRVVGEKMTVIPLDRPKKLLLRQDSRSAIRHPSAGGAAGGCPDPVFAAAPVPQRMSDGPRSHGYARCGHEKREK